MLAINSIIWILYILVLLLCHWMLVLLKMNDSSSLLGAYVTVKGNIKKLLWFITLLQHKKLYQLLVPLSQSWDFKMWVEQEPGLDLQVNAICTEMGLIGEQFTTIVRAIDPKLYGMPRTLKNTNVTSNATPTYNGGAS